jgi:hypothetical protein
MTSPLCPFGFVQFFMVAKILNEKYAIYSGTEIEQRKKNKSTDSHYFELFSSFVLS